MKKKLLLVAAAIGTSVTMLPLLAAFEAHVINVTATIENALTVPLEATGLHYGTTFPQEALDQKFDVTLSQSFDAQDRVNVVQYTIRQKPKCGVPNPVDPNNPTAPTTYSSYPQVTEDASGKFVCPAESVMLPLLCPYLSKHETTCDPTNGTTEGGCLLENDSLGINSFHGSTTAWSMTDTLATAVTGVLNQSTGDMSDTWDIDLHVPCFTGNCAQDWAHFVTTTNPGANPADYMANPNDEHKLFGCDLWLETTGISK